MLNIISISHAHEEAAQKLELEARVAFAMRTRCYLVLTARADTVRLQRRHLDSIADDALYAAANDILKIDLPGSPPSAG